MTGSKRKNKTENTEVIFDAESPLDLIRIACELMNWTVAFEILDREEDELDGIILGTPEWIREKLTDLDEFELAYPPNKKVKQKKRKK